MSRRNRRYRSEPGLGTFAAVGIGALILNLIFYAAVVAVIVLVLKALGVL